MQRAQPPAPPAHAAPAAQATSSDANAAHADTSMEDATAQQGTKRSLDEDEDYD